MSYMTLNQRKASVAAESLKNAENETITVVAASQLDNDHVTAKTVPYDTVRTHRHLLFPQSHRFMNKNSPIQQKGVEYKLNYDIKPTVSLSSKLKHKRSKSQHVRVILCYF